MRRFVAATLAVPAIALGACGEGDPAPSDTTAKLPQPLPHLIGPDISQDLQIIKAGQPENPGLDLNKLQPERYLRVGAFVGESAGINYIVETYGEKALPKSATTGLVAKVQSDLIAVSKKYGAIEAKIHDTKTSKMIKTTSAVLNIIDKPTIMFLAPKTEVSRQDGKEPVAGTYTPRNPALKGIKNSISFVTPGSTAHSDSYYQATQACNAKIEVQTDQGEPYPSAQIAVCGSFALAYADVATGVTYADYVKTAQKLSSFQVSKGTFLRSLILPPAAYSQLQRNQTPLALKGLRESPGYSAAPVKPKAGQVA